MFKKQFIKGFLGVLLTLTIGSNTTYAAELPEEPSTIVTTDATWQDIATRQMQAADAYQDLMAELSNCTDLMYWYDRYISLFAQYADICDGPESIYDYYTAEDIEYLLRMCETECHGQDFESKVHVCEVALNRVDSSRFPNTPTKVVTTPHQFSYSRKMSEVTDETRKALECAFQIPDLTKGSLYFHSIKECSNFYGQKFVFQDKAGHKFYC